MAKAKAKEKARKAESVAVAKAAAGAGAAGAVAAAAGAVAGAEFDPYATSVVCGVGGAKSAVAAKRRNAGWRFEETDLSEAEADEVRGMPYLLEAIEEARANAVVGGEKCGGEFGDLVRIPSAMRGKGLVFLRSYSESGRSKRAMVAAGMACWELSRCRIASKAFRAAHDMLIEARYAERAADIEEAVSELAAGRRKADDGVMPPDVRAAALVLPVMNSRYRDAGAAAQQVQINVSV